MIIEYSLVGSAKSNGIVERAIQSVQGTIRTIRSAIEDKREVKIDVGRGSPTRQDVSKYERLKEKSAKVLEGTLRRRRRAGGPLGKLTCM